MTTATIERHAYFRTLDDAEWGRRDNGDLIFPGDQWMRGSDSHPWVFVIAKVDGGCRLEGCRWDEVLEPLDDEVYATEDAAFAALCAWYDEQRAHGIVHEAQAALRRHGYQLTCEGMTRV